MAELVTVRTKRDITIVISDSGAANSYTVSVEPGDFNYASPRHTVVRPLDRGEFVTPRKGDAQPTTLGFSVHLRDIGNSTTSALPDICEQRGWAGSNWTSTLSTSSDVFAVDVAVTYDGTAAGEADRTLTFGDMSLRGSYSDGDPSAYTVSGEASILVPTLS